MAKFHGFLPTVAWQIAFSVLKATFLQIFKNSNPCRLAFFEMSWPCMLADYKFWCKNVSIRQAQMLSMSLNLGIKISVITGQLATMYYVYSQKLLIYDIVYLNQSS